MEQDRRQTPSYPFHAHAEISVENSSVDVTARLYELSRQGCRLFVVNPLPVSTSIVAKIYVWPYFLQVRATVCHSDPDTGVEVTSNDIGAQYVSVLNACVLEAEQKQRNRTR